MADLGAVGQDGGFGGGFRQYFHITTVVSPTTMTVSGNVYDDTSTAAERIVRLYRRSDGAFIGEITSTAGTGAYSLAAPNEEVQRIVLDDAGGSLYNDIIDRVIPA
jgi:hypothetical protein